MKLFQKSKVQEEHREVEFDVEGLDIYSIEYKPDTGETCFSYHTEKEDIEQTIVCDAGQHNAFVRRFKQKLKGKKWKTGNPKKDGLYAIQFETQALCKTTIVTVGTFKAAGFSYISSKWLVINVCPDSKDAKVEFMMGNVVAYKNL